MRERVPRSHGAVGSTEEKWSCQLIIPDAHERTIYSVSWGEAPDADTSDGSELGWLASAGGDGAVNIWRIRVCFCLTFLIIALPDSSASAGEVSTLGTCSQPQPHSAETTYTR